MTAHHVATALFIGTGLLAAVSIIREFRIIWKELSKF